jgi:hypothetical protein
MLSEQKQQEIAIEEAYKEKIKKLEEAGIEDDGTLLAAKNKELQAVQDKFRKEEEEKNAEFLKAQNEIRTQTRLEGIKDENEKAREQLAIEYQKQRDEILNNEKFTAEQKTSLLLDLKDQEKQALDTLQKSFDEANTMKELEKLDAEMKKAENDFETQRTLLDQKQALIDAQYKYDLDKQAEYNAATEENTNARIELDAKEKEAKLANASQIAGFLSSVSDLAGRNTAAGKATAIAATTIDTYVGAQKAYISQMQLTPDSPIRAAIAAAVALATGIKNVREIAKVKVPGGSAASAPSISAAAPGGVPQVPTIGNSPITALGAAMQPTQPLRAYVVESEVTGTQKRVADIERRAGF